MILKVKSGGCILVGHKRYLPGQLIPEGVLTPKQIRQHQQSGYLSVTREAPRQMTAAEIEAESKKAVPDAPGVAVTPVDSEGKPAPQLASRWALDPDGLRGMELDALNVMILERDPAMEPADTVEEAIGLLSQDFEAPE